MQDTGVRLELDFPSVSAQSKLLSREDGARSMRKVPTEKDVSRDAGINDGGGNAGSKIRTDSGGRTSFAQTASSLLSLPIKLQKVVLGSMSK